MGLLGLLKFALLCVDFLAWPVIALCYPVFASIRAIETDSKHHMKKLVIYWTLFALISLFEFAFAKIIEWIPLWSSIKLVAAFWLVIPRFDGSCLVYQDLLRPCLSGNPQAVLDKFYWLKKKRSRKIETFLDVADKYIKENGSEALEKLIAPKLELKEPDDSQRETQVQEPEEKNAAVISESLKGPDSDTTRKDNEMLEATEKTTATLMNQTTEVKEMIPPEASPRNRNTETPLFTKVHQQDWICDLCQVTTTSEITLNAHLRGNKHKSNCEYLKIKLCAEEKGPKTSAATICTSNGANPEAAKVKVGEASQQKSCEKIKERVRFQVANEQEKRAKLKQEWQQKASEKIDERIGFEVANEQEKQGKLERGRAAAETFKLQYNLDPTDKSQRETQVQEPEEKNVASISGQLKVSDTARQDNKMLEATAKTAATETKQHGEVKEMISQEASPRKTPLLMKVHQQEWICGLCQVTTTSKKTLNAHLQGNKHKSNCEHLKSKLNAEETGPTTSPTTTRISNLVANNEQEKRAKLKQEWHRTAYEKIEKRVCNLKDGAANATKLHCSLCDVKLLSDIDMEAHLKGKRHSSNIERIGEAVVS